VYELREGVARITINRPSVMNAMTSGMWPEMGEMIASIEPRTDVRCVLIRGAGENFCAGGDVNEFSSTLDMPAEERAVFWARSSDRTNWMFQLIERIPQTVVVSARGVVAGGGLALVAAADLAIVSQNTRFLAAQIRIGAIPDSVLGYNMVRSVGLKRAKQYGLLGDTFDADTALEMGLVNWAVPETELDGRTETLLARLTKNPRIAMARTKAELNFAWTRTLADHCAQESQDVAACVVEPDYPERVRAFLARPRR
jgi:2-(1,2-epoxy-1,2-dihydrophenyl)acetyl-CoA isomerase